MTRRRASRGFAARPSDPEAWVRAPERVSASGEAFTARLTVDVTLALRARIKVTAFERHVTVADMLRALLEREYLDGEHLAREDVAREDVAREEVTPAGSDGGA